MALSFTRQPRVCREFVVRLTGLLPAPKKYSTPSKTRVGFFVPQKFRNVPEMHGIICFRLTGGKSESYANLAEGMATALVCFDDLEERRDQGTPTQKHCILICNSVPYSMPVQECYMYENKTVDQLATIFQEKEINFSILSPRKIPVLFKLFEKSGGDLSSSTSKNYCKDPRHLVLLKGYSLKERPASPPAAATINLPSPLASNMMPMNNQMEAAGNQMLAAQQINQPGPMRTNMNNPGMFPDAMQNPMGNPNIPRPGLMYPGQGPNPNQMNPPGFHCTPQSDGYVHAIQSQCAATTDGATNAKSKVDDATTAAASFPPKSRTESATAADANAAATAISSHYATQYSTAQHGVSGSWSDEQYGAAASHPDATYESAATAAAATTTAAAAATTPTTAAAAAAAKSAADAAAKPRSRCNKIKGHKSTNRCPKISPHQHNSIWHQQVVFPRWQLVVLPVGNQPPIQGRKFGLGFWSGLRRQRAINPKLHATYRAMSQLISKMVNQN
uniref:Mediator of RNA polymerase II transcription subunit 25 n=1 Tax=Lutzomyia longipalpis TaxID=7200 RepID=A0A1B0C941_LUTLO